MTQINLAIAGATGWTGSAIVDGALAAPDISLEAAIARSSAGQDLGTATPVDGAVHASAAEQGGVGGVDDGVRVRGRDVPGGDGELHGFTLGAGGRRRTGPVASAP